MIVGKTSSVTYGTGKNAWLASRHGVENADPITLDGTALAAVFTDGNVPGGVILAKKTSTGLYGLYNQAGTDGLNVPLGLLVTGHKVKDSTGTTIAKVGGALLRHGQVFKALLPRTAAETGGPHADAITALKNVVFR